LHFTLEVGERSLEAIGTGYLSRPGVYDIDSDINRDRSARAVGRGILLASSVALTVALNVVHQPDRAAAAIWLAAFGRGWS
jgi:hypothetical protein